MNETRSALLSRGAMAVKVADWLPPRSNSTRSDAASWPMGTRPVSSALTESPSIDTSSVSESIVSQLNPNGDSQAPTRRPS